MQTEVNQTAVVDDAGGIHQLGTSAECRLTDSELELIHIADDIVRLTRLLYLPKVFAGVPLVYVNQRTFLVHTGRIMIQLAEQTIRIGRIGNNGRTVRRSVLAHDKIGAGQCIRHGCHNKQDGKSQSFTFHTSKL